MKGREIVENAKLLRKNYKNKVLRKVYNKKGTQSLLFNIPLEFANDLNIVNGDYLTITKEAKNLIISKTEFKEESNNEK